jgi:phosphoglycolate phosphatase
MKLKNLFFDLDGTIIESSQGILNGFRRTFDKLGHPQLPEATLNTFIGPPLDETFRHLSKGDINWAKKATAIYRDYYGKIGVLEATPYEGILEMLKALQQLDYNLYIATSKKEDVAKKMLETFKLTPYFNGVFGNTPETSSKTLVLKKSLIATGARPETSVMIGDRKYDIIGGIENNVAKTIGVLWGFGDIAELKNAGSDAIITQPHELLENIK